MSFTARALSLLAALMLAAGPVAAASRSSGTQIHPKVKSKEKTIRQVLLLPAQVEIQRSGMKGGEGMLKESEDVSLKILDAVGKALKDRGFQVADKPPAAAGDEAQYSLASLQKRYDAVAVQLHKRMKDVSKGRFTLGDEVANYGPAAATDSVLFVRGQGTQLTGGKKAFGILVAGAKASTMRCYVTLVDSKSGEVLFTTMVFVTGGGFIDRTEEVFRKPLAKALQKIPAAT